MTAVTRESCEKLLGEVMSMRNHTMTSFEAEIWLAIIDGSKPEEFAAFLKLHVLSSKFAPTPADANAALRLQGGDAQVAYKELEDHIRLTGPYRAPTIDDEVLVAAIQNLGGWVAVNEQFPSSSETYLTKAYRERFDAAYKVALNQVRIQNRHPMPLVAFGGKRTDLIGNETTQSSGMRLVSGA